MRVDENLRIVAVEPVDAHLREAAVLAIVLDPHAGLERKAPGERRGVDFVEQLGAEHADQRRGLAPQSGGPAGRDNDLVHRNAALLDVEIDLQRLARTQHDLLLQGRVTQLPHFERAGALGQILQIIMARRIGSGAVGRTLHGDRSVRNMFAGLPVDNVTHQIGIGMFGRSSGIGRPARKHRPDAQQRQEKIFHGK